MSFCLYDTSRIAFSLMNVSMRNFFLYILTKKRINQLFPFFINLLLVCCVFIVNWIGKIDDLFVVHIFISLLNWFIRIAWVYWETHFNSFFQINEFLQRNTQFQRNNLKLWSSSPTEPRFHKDCRLHCYAQYCTRSPTTWYVDNW